MTLKTKGIYREPAQTGYATPDIPYVHEVSFQDIDGNGAMDVVLFGGSFRGDRSR